MQLLTTRHLAGGHQDGSVLAAESVECLGLAHHASLDHAAVALKTAALRLFCKISNTQLEQKKLLLKNHFVHTAHTRVTPEHHVAYTAHNEMT